MLVVMGLTSVDRSTIYPPSIETRAKGLPEVLSSREKGDSVVMRSPAVTSVAVEPNLVLSAETPMRSPCAAAVDTAGPLLRRLCSAVG